jgi:integrase
MSEYAYAGSRWVVPFFGSMLTTAIRDAHIHDFVDHLRSKGLRDDTIVTYLKPLRLALGDAKRRELIQGNPCSGPKAYGLKKQRRQRVLSVAEIRALLAHAEVRERVAVMVMTFTGLRLAEMCALRWRDIDFAAATMRVRAQAPHASDPDHEAPKSRAGYRRIPVAPLVLQLLSEFRMTARFPAGHDYVITSHAHHGAPLSPSGLRQSWWEVIRRAGLDDDPELALHTLRHTFCTRVVLGDPRTTMTEAMAYMGHSEMSSTWFYAHPLADDEAAQAFAARQDTRFAALHDLLALGPCGIDRPEACS